MIIGRSVGRASVRRPGFQTFLAAGLVPCGMVLSLIACSPSSPVFEDAFETALLGSPEPAPPYEQIVAAALRNFKKQEDLIDLEISQPFWTEHLGGPAWVVCVKFNPKANAYYYTFFIRKQQVADVRFSVGTDRCGGRTFSPFSLKPVVSQ